MAKNWQHKAWIGLVLFFLGSLVIVLSPILVISKVNAAQSGYYLPYPAGKSYVLNRGIATDPKKGHPSDRYNKFAFDFEMPPGSDVVAAKDGTVRLVKQNSNQGGCDQRLVNLANYVVIDHGNNESTQYLHLQQNSVSVSQGQTVRQGQKIGRSGATGWSCGAHLHYTVIQTPSKGSTNPYTNSLPSSFSDPDVTRQNSNGIPVASRTYTSANVAPTGSSIKYQAHVQNIGWQNWVENGQTAGTTAQSRRMEAIKINLVNAPSGSVCYDSHIQNVGWLTGLCNGAVAGTTGQNLRMEAIRINLVNPPSGLGVCYRAHVQNIGWQDWVCNGQVAGTTGQSLRMEAIEIKLTPR